MPTWHRTPPTWHGTPAPVGPDPVFPTLANQTFVDVTSIVIYFTIAKIYLL